VKHLFAEVGPIRPPSESRSLLIRFSRNCPWNKCLFCPAYKNEKFSLRSLDELKRELLYLSEIYTKLKSALNNTTLYELSSNLKQYFPEEQLHDAHRMLHWIYHQEFNIFIQDADPLLRKPSQLIELLSLLKQLFPETNRITSYARATTINRFSTEELFLLKNSGLSRIHMGLESGSDNVLKFVCKGFKSKDVVDACNKLKQAGIESSLYIMPGLGGKNYTKEHVTETIRTINLAKPNFLRLRTIGLNSQIPLYYKFASGEFLILSEEEIVKEINDIIQGIEVELNLYSDHNLNLLMEINGTLPKDKNKLLSIIKRFLSFSEQKKILFILSRRMNKVFELGEFLSFSPDEEIQDLFEQIKHLNKEEREKFFLRLRSQNL
jgi:hypothetical protein